MQLDDNEIERIVALLKVLADRSRSKLLALLGEREYSVKELANALALREPTISAHLKMMKEHQLVEMRQDGTTHFYRLRQEGIVELLRSLLAKMPKEADEASNPDAFERHVLNHFFQKGRLIEFPTQRSKQLVVLKRLATEFMPGERYTEKQVSETLKAFHLDFATLRRQLVDHKFLARENSIYWRVEAEA